MRTTLPSVFEILAATLVAGSCLGAQIRVLGPGIDLNDGINPTDMVSASFGPGEPQIFHIDGIKRTLSRTSVDLPRFVGPSTLMMADLPPDSHLLTADIDKDGLQDAVLLAGKSGYVWASASPTGPDGAAPLTFQLPPAAHRGFLAPPTSVADFDGDGADDLLVPPPPDFEGQGIPPIDESPGWVIFSFATPEAEAVPLPTTRRSTAVPAPPFLPGGNPVIALAADSSTEILACGPDRIFVRLETLPLRGTFAELDGATPPELIQPPSFAHPGRVLIHQRGDGTWPVTDELTRELPEGFSGSIFPQLSAVADFDGDGRDELLLGLRQFGLFSQTPSTTLLDVVEMTPEGAFSVATLPAMGGGFQSMKALGIGTGPPRLVAFRLSVESTDALGNPVAIPGTGHRATIRNRPLATAPGSSDDWEPFAGSKPSQSAVGTLDPDPFPDVATLSDTGRFSSLSPAAGVEPVRRSFPAGSDPLSSLGLADLDGNGLDDPIAARGDRILSFLALSPTSPQQFATGPSLDFPSSSSPAPNRILGSADFDGDGDPDPLVIRAIDETLGWLELSDSRQFTTFHPIALAGRTYGPGNSLETGGYRWIGKEQTLIFDADGDGDPDIITHPSALGNRPALHRNTSVGFSIEALGPLEPEPTSPPYPTPGSLPRLFRGNFHSGNEILETGVITSTLGILGEPGHAFHLLGDDGPSSSPVILGPAESAVAVDFDLDGHTDLITASGPRSDALGNPVAGTGILLQRNRGDASFEPPVPLASPLGFVTELLAADFNGDSLPDVVATSTATHTVELFLQELASPHPSFGEWAGALSLSDPSADGDPDGNGLANLIEYVSGTFPGATAPPPGFESPPPFRPTITREPFWLLHATICRPRRPDGNPLQITLEESGDLASWTPLGEPEVSIDPRAPLWETLRWSFPTYGGEPLFHRFRVELPLD